MEAIYTVVAAVVVKYLVDLVKVAGAWISQIAPTLPGWVVSLVPLWKLLAAIAVTLLVVWGTKQFAVELSHPLVVLVLAQVAHELADAVKKRKKSDDEDTPD